MFHPCNETVETSQRPHPSVFGLSSDVGAIHHQSQDRFEEAPKVETTEDTSRKAVSMETVLKDICGLSMSCTLNALAAEAEKNAAWRDEFNKFAVWRFYTAVGYVIVLASLVSLLASI